MKSTTTMYNSMNIENYLDKIPSIIEHLKKIKMFKTTPPTAAYNSITLDDGSIYTIYSGIRSDYNYISITIGNSGVFIEIDFDEQLECSYYDSNIDIITTVLHNDEAQHFQYSLVKETLDYESVLMILELAAHLVCAINLHFWVDNKDGFGYSELSKRIQEIKNG